MLVQANSKFTLKFPGFRESGSHFIESMRLETLVWLLMRNITPILSNYSFIIRSLI